VGHSRKRPGKDGKPRYTAYYFDIKGQERSAGTFPNKKDADKAWQQAEAEVSKGRNGNVRRGRQTFKEYVENRWLPNHMMEPQTRQSYTSMINKHILPEFGPMRMVDIAPEHVRAWVAKMQANDASPRLIQYCKGSILNAIFTTAFDDQVIFFHPSRGVKTPTVPEKAPQDHHHRTVRQDLPGTPPRRRPAPHRDRRRKRPTLGRTHRTARQGPRHRNPHPHHQPRRRRTQPRIPRRRQALPREGLPEGRRVPPLQTQPPDRRQAHRPHRDRTPQRQRPVLRLPPRRPAQSPAADHSRRLRPRQHRTQRKRVAPTGTAR
jgi:hypothetical protein